MDNWVTGSLRLGVLMETDQVNEIRFKKETLVVK